ncbi:MAG TPA: glycosyltransferase family 4 protein [Nitrospira sp.]|nr:glycosyltransferase family 4 protein [Nitrospira sp.]
MRLLFINRYFYPDISATAQLLTELAEDLAAKGESVTVITGNAAYADSSSRLAHQEIYKGIRILRVGFTRFGRKHTFGRLVDYLSFWIAAFLSVIRARHQDCLVVLSDPPLLSVLAALVGMVKPLKTVCWLQDVFPEIAVRAVVLPEGLIAQCLRWLSRWSLRQMDQVVVIGRCMVRQVLSEGVPFSALARIPNWADGSHIKPLPRSQNIFLDCHNLQNQFVVMYSGNHGVVHEFDSVADLVRATTTVPGLCFCFIGEGAWKRKLMAMSEAEGWKHVVFLPYQPKSALECSLSAADVHLVSLKHGMEGLCVPSKIYGALAAGRPVLFVGPADSEAAHIIREAKCGSQVAPGDISGAVNALLAFYRDRVLVEKQGRASREYFERHCHRTLLTERFRQVLHRICRQPRPLFQIKPSSSSSRGH